jgi:hypothetical protein
MFLDPMPLAYAISMSPIAYAFPAAPSSGIANEDVVDAAPLNQGPPPGTGADKKRRIKPHPEPVVKTKRQKVGMPLPKKQRPVASG